MTELVGIGTGTSVRPLATVVSRPVTVVGQQFSMPRIMELTVTKKVMSLSDGDFIVTDTNGSILMRVQGRVFSFPMRRVLLDSAGNVVLSIQMKVISARGRWNVYRGESSDNRNLLFSVRRSSVFQFKTELDVFLAGNTTQKTCDFKIKASFLDRTCTFHLGDTDTIMGVMKRQYIFKHLLVGKDTYVLTVYPNVDYAFIIALSVVFNEIRRMKEREAAE